MPPADIPVEASETLAFTPPSLEGLKNPPVFTLRAVTSRDKRHHRRMVREAGITRHSDEDLRALARSELRRLWGEENFSQFIVHIEEYWHAVDDWVLQVKDDPAITFSFDEEKMAAIDELTKRLYQNSPAYRSALADNADAGEQSPLLVMAVVIRGASGVEGLSSTGEMFHTLEDMDALRDRMREFDREAGSEEGTAFNELFVACARRMRLLPEEAKNSASPSPSDPDQQSSENGTEGKTSSGKSRASAKSPAKKSTR